MNLFQFDFRRSLTVALITFLLFSCSTYSDKEKAEFEEDILTYLEEKQLEMHKLENGMFYRVINQGEGDDFIKLNDRLTFHYTGSFLTGEVFQEISAKNPLTFRVRELIIGWQDALTMLKNGGEIKIILPPYLAYGDNKTELIPANSVLFYHLKVLSVE